MRSSFIAFVALATYVSAHAIEKRQEQTGGDATVLNYALTLEVSFLRMSLSSPSYEV